jgi:hypothetical protein
MAFCNACGTNLQPDARFCPKCGATVPATTSRPVASTAPMASPAVPAATPVTMGKPNQAVKIILIVVAVLVGLGILGTIAATYVGLKIARHTKVEEHDGNVRVQTPFGSVESSQDADHAIRDMGIDAYPGAEAIEKSAANVNIGGMHTVSVQMQTDDPPAKVAQFYQQQLPNANVNISDNDRYTIVSNKRHNLVTVNIEPQDGKTMIHIASVTGKGVDAHTESDGKAEE